MKYVYRKRAYRVFFSVLDVLGTFIFYPFRMFRRRKDSGIHRIVVVRADHVGDLVAATAVLPLLKKEYPDVQVDIICPSWGADILKADPHVDNIVMFDPPWFDRKGAGKAGNIKGFFRMARLLRSGKYDVFIDLRGDVRHIAAGFLARIKCRISYGITGGGFLLTDMVPYKENIHETERNTALLKPLGITAEISDAALYFDDADIINVSRVKKENKLDTPYAVVHVIPGHASKRWNGRGFRDVLRFLEGKGIISVMVGSSDDSIEIKSLINESGVNAVDLSGKITIGELGPLCAGASVFVGLDSGPAHISAYAGVPTIILFSGVNDPAQWAPRGDNVRIIYPGKGKDLSLITAEEVILEIDKWGRFTRT